MSFDGIVTRAVVHELNQVLSGGRITKIYQPADLELILHIRSQGKNHQLLLSAHPAFARVQLTKAKADNPSEPPMFCMLLRKHAEGGIIESIHQVGMERIIQIDFRTRDELGDVVKRRLVMEIMGRHSNIILLDPEKNVVFDGIRRVSHAISKYRQIYPGVPYLEPPSQGKRNPLTADKNTFISGFDYNGGRLDKQIVARFTGISPLLAKEIVEQTGPGSRDQLWETFSSYMERAREHDFRPVIIKAKQKSHFYVWPLSHLDGEIQSFPSISECLEHFYYGKAQRDRIRQQTHDLMRKLKNEIEKNTKKIEILQNEINQADKADQYRMFGELVTASLYQIKRGDTEVKTINYFDPETPEVTIPLDPTLSPPENAQRYFKKYNKLKAAKKWNTEQIEKAKEENLYLESVLVQLENCSLREVEQIRDELAEQGWLKRQSNKRERKRKDVPAPLKVISGDGTVILVGKNNKQNDYLTHQLASSTDTWLHTKEIPGSHVVIRSKQVTDQTLLEAAMLAAYFSKGRESSRVPVDYTLIKHVKKPSGARPGFVTYENQKTLYVTPEEEQIKKILERQPE
ncbi:MULTISPECIES: NFACT family protein [Thermoactinomyces]|uniref:Rqc2 homolog RqcH n=1 Tax=Thermoactinomyces daqus TaxID=1329516 RepID=A0A7W2AI52_9BACL|nr:MULTISPECIES: NFACT RNA binding domain-containing protein [Thermoactinomyces]MBA4542503.1 NFACT family protein [Thermoactinomyces daqus]MBH8598097.1 NFACT family protein [Thermoactinomyces sp. CICC 10523]MBH8607065.1 NFACT family protein [Thermoactinomyces sp. CICC 10521]